MKLTFHIDYRTVWGESLGVVIEGGAQEQAPFMLSTVDGEHWSGTDEMPDLPVGTTLSYRYVIVCGERQARREIGAQSHCVRLNAQPNFHYNFHDYWRDLPADAPCYSSAFSGPSRFKGKDSNEVGATAVDKAPCYLTFRALCPCLRQSGRRLAICGGGEAFGAWRPECAVLMDEVADNQWQLTLPSRSLAFPLEYKFVVVEEQSRKVVAWETRDNRWMEMPEYHNGDCYITPEEEIRFATAQPKVAGTAIPVFSLRSEGSFGVGDFGDLMKLIDWAVLTHQRAIQILPINDTTITQTWTDSYPYNSISIYAFHPMYVDLRQLPALKDKKAAEAYEEERRKLNALPQVDYEAVNNAKRAYLRRLFKQEGKAVLASEGFKKFFAENAHWLMPYGAFSFFRDQYFTPDFSKWPEHRVYNKEEIAKLCSPKSKSYDAIAFYYYVQYQLHLQLLAASNYARQNGVIFKGDIPIGISRNSVEAWVEPYYFNMDGQAGAPPDAFSTKGQNWGFPTYNWDFMAKDNYQWWQKRFRKMAEYFSAYRIDHILGFFRIWEIPTHSVHGLLGQFSPSLPMSVDEIQSYGLPFQKDFMTRPFINDDILHRMFGDRAAYVKQHFLKHLHDDIYEMLPQFATQRQVEACFADKQDEASRNLKEGLYALISDVLFVVDRKNPEMFHPRISVQTDFIFERLTGGEKEAFNRLYNDYYYRRHNQFWYEEAMKKLPILTQSTDMLVCGEDLGMVPDCVAWVMNQLQILSLEIQRMPKNPALEFGHLWEYPARSVCTFSTHDMSTLRGWWEEDSDLTARYFHNELGHSDELPTSAPGWVCEDILRRHLESPSMLCVLAFQDWLAINERIRLADPQTERINVPANPRHYWRYRMHLTLEQLLSDNEFNHQVRGLIDAGHRG